jgi:hypothetical protein
MTNLFSFTYEERKKMAMETASILTEDIGLGGDVIEACLLLPDVDAGMITSDEDLPHCRKDTLDLKKALEEAGIEAPLYDAQSTVVDGQKLDCGHVFCIARPEWPQGVKSLQLISDNFCRR